MSDTTQINQVANEPDVVRRSNKATAVLGVATAVLTLLTAVLGLLTARATQQKDQAQDRATGLSTEVDALTTERTRLRKEVTTLQLQKDALQNEVEQLRSPSTAPTSQALAGGLTYLSKEDMLARNQFDIGSEPVSGQIFTNSVIGYQSYCGSSSRETYGDFDLGRRFKTLTGTLGLSDKNRSVKLRVQFKVLVDGNQVFTATLGAGAAKPLKISVDGRLRIRLMAIFLTPDDCNESDKAVWGDIAVA